MAAFGQKAAVPVYKAMRVVLGTTKDTPIETTRFLLDLPPMQTRQKAKQVKAHYFQSRRESPQPTPRSHKRHKGMQTGTGQVLDGASRGHNTASMPADKAQANQGVGKVPKPIPAFLQDTLGRKFGNYKALSRMTSRQNGVRDQASHSRK